MSNPGNSAYGPVQVQSKGRSVADFCQAMQSEDSLQPPLTGGFQVVLPTADPVVKPPVPQTTFGDVCELHVGRARLAQIMGVSVRTIDRLVALGMPSETWGLQRRVFRPSAALKWAQTRTEVLV